MTPRRACDHDDHEQYDHAAAEETVKDLMQDLGSRHWETISGGVEKGIKCGPGKPHWQPQVPCRSGNHYHFQGRNPLRLLFANIITSGIIYNSVDPQGFV